MNQNNAKRPRVRKWDLWVLVMDKLLTRMRPIALVGTILVLCLVVYAIAWAMKRR